MNNAEEEDAVVVGIFYSNPQRLDVHFNKEYIPALNMQKNEQGKFVTKSGNFMPTVNMPIGEFSCPRSTCHAIRGFVMPTVNKLLGELSCPLSTCH